jgi:hypothetical protein
MINKVRKKIMLVYGSLAKNFTAKQTYGFANSNLKLTKSLITIKFFVFFPKKLLVDGFYLLVLLLLDILTLEEQVVHLGVIGLFLGNQNLTYFHLFIFTFLHCILYIRVPA